MSFRKFASCITAERVTIENWRKQVIASSVKQDPTVVPQSPAFDVDEGNFVYVRARAVSAGEYHGANGNGDFFPEAELQANYKTFIRRGNYLNHESDDVSKAVGIILDAKYWDTPETKYVECLLAVDKSHPIADKIIKGISTDLSMGAIVEKCECSICHKEASTEGEYCTHMQSSMGKEYNGRKVYAINKGVNFYELSWVTVGADPDAKCLQVIAEQKSDPKFDQLVKMADAFQSSKEHKLKLTSISGGGYSAECSQGDWSATFAGETTKEHVQDKFQLHVDNVKKHSHAADDKKEPKAPPKPPTPPQKKDKDLEQIVEQVVMKEVDKTIEQELVGKVRDMLKKLQPKQQVQREISDDELLQAVRDELAQKLQSPVAVPITSALHQVVDQTIQDIEKQADGKTLDLGDGMTVLIYGKVAGNCVAQLLNHGQPTGLFVVACADGDETTYYKEKFAIAAPKTEPETESTQKSTEEVTVSSKLVIRYIPDVASLDKCAFVARKGNLEVRQSAAKLLAEVVQKTILAHEKRASGKVEKGVGEYDSTKGKIDNKIEEGKENASPDANTKNLGKVEKGVGDYDVTNGKIDNKIEEGKEPIQPSQVVSKYAAQIGGKVISMKTDPKTSIVEAQIEGGSIARLAQLWGTRPTLVKEAKIAGTPGGWAREETSPVQADPKKHEGMIARETPASVDGTGPKGSRGGEQVKYYGGWNKGNLSDAGPDGWARKVAAKKLAALQSQVAEKDTTIKLLQAALTKTKKAQDDDKRATLVTAIMARLAGAGLLAPDQGDILEWKEKGLEHEDAVVKAAQMAHERQKKELAGMDIAALERMQNVINKCAAQNNRTVERETPKSVDIPVIGSEQASSFTLEDKLKAGW